MLSNIDILKVIKNGSLKISGFNESKLDSCSYKLSLGNRFYLTHEITEPIDLMSIEKTKEAIKYGIFGEMNLVILKPDDFILAVTLEDLEIPSNMVGFISGRSGHARLGMTTHITADRIDPGFNGPITMEIKNLGKSPLTLKTGMEIAAITFEELKTPTDKSYKGSKTNQKWPIPFGGHRFETQ